MSMTVAAAEMHNVQSLQDNVTIPRALMAQIVVAINAVPEYDGLSLVDDVQCGYVAQDVSPTVIEAALAALPVEAATAIRNAIQPMLDFAAKDGWGLNFDSRDDLHWVPDAKPEIRLTDDRLDSPAVQWSASRVTRAFKSLGFSVNDEFFVEIPAVDLKTACEGRSEQDAVRLATIADYAIQRNGPNAKVVAI